MLYIGMGVPGIGRGVSGREGGGAMIAVVWPTFVKGFLSFVFAVYCVIFLVSMAEALLLFLHCYKLYTPTPPKMKGENPNKY